MNKSIPNFENSVYLESKTKRCFDIFFCILFLFPVLAVITILVLIVAVIEGRPVFFTQPRAGKDGKIFLMTKIRTLSSKANPNMPSHGSKVNAFVTFTGGFLRKHRLDELPQLFSVLRGEMSLVGPRPALPNIAARYGDVYKNRLVAKPGITGLWQINAPRNVAMGKNIKYDLYYLRKASLWLDIKILAQTVPFVLNLKPMQNSYENRIYPYNISVTE